MAAWLVGLLLLAPDLQTDVAEAVRRARVNRTGLSIVVGSAGAATPAYSLAATTPRAPASNQKVLTAAAALWRLGGDFRFQTKICVGPGGELVVIGDGDPNLSGRFFDGDPNRILRRLAADIARHGKKHYTALVLDASRFDAEYVHPDWPRNQLERWYCAPVAALVFNDSCWDLTVLPGAAVGAPARVEVQPALLQPALVNRCRTVGERGRHVVHIGRAAERGLEVRGGVLLASKGYSGHITVRDPVAFFGEAFRAALLAEGVTVDKVRTGRAQGLDPVVVYRSALRRTLPVMLTNSQNLYAECVFKRLGAGSFASAAKALTATLQSRGVDTSGFDVRDGSGLAASDRITARALYQTLQALRDEPDFVDAFARGGEGTLRRRYRDLGPRIRAKTGTIRGVSALSGYVTAADGTRTVFVILANGASVARSRNLMDRVVTALANAGTR